MKSKQVKRTISKVIVSRGVFIKIPTLVLLSLLFCSHLLAAVIVVTNTAPFARVHEIITVERNALGKVNHKLFPVVTKKNHGLTYQLIDTNRDNNWDEMLIEIDLAPHARDTLQVRWVNRQQQPFKKIANVQLSLRADTNFPNEELNNATRLRGFTQNIAKPFYQLEGPGIENDKVAFRVFFDSRNSKDIYGKIVDTPALEKVGVGAGWHNLQPWGMDIFHTGNSLGAGGLAVEENNHIYRLGDADTSVFTALYEGALQASFKLDFKNWDVGAGRKNGSETLELTKGNFFYKDIIEVDINNLQQLIAGIANFGTYKVVYKKYNAKFSAVSIYGKQAEGTGTRLGVGILFPSTDYIKNFTTDTASVVPNTTCIKLKPSVTGKKILYFFACWEKTDRRFETAQGFEAYLRQTSEVLANPVQISILNNENY